MDTMRRIALVHGAAALALALDEDTQRRKREAEIEAEANRPRNYDIEGPRIRHDPAPAEPLTRQQRRKLERQAEKRR